MICQFLKKNLPHYHPIKCLLRHYSTKIPLILDMDKEKQIKLLTTGGYD